MYLLIDVATYSPEVVILFGETLKGISMQRIKTLKSFLSTLHRVGKGQFNIVNLSAIGVIRGPMSFSEVRILCTSVNLISTMRHIPVIVLPRLRVSSMLSKKQYLQQIVPMLEHRLAVVLKDPGSTWDHQGNGYLPLLPWYSREPHITHAKKMSV